MSYSQEVYSKATERLERRREKANIESQIKNDEILNKIPEIKTINTELSQIGMSIAKVFFDNNNDPVSAIESLKNQSLSLQEKRKNLLLKNGYADNELDINYYCKKCNDTGFVKNKLCSCHIDLLKQIERDNLKKIAPIDDCTFDTFNIDFYSKEAKDGSLSDYQRAQAIKTSCQNYANNFNLKSNSLLLMGGTGLGKTHLSLAIANKVIDKGYSVVYGTSQNILNDLSKENFNKDADVYYYERAVLNCDLLIIDDLGTEFKTQYTTACLFNIINSRLNSKLPTIISTNYDHIALEEKYDQRVTSRLSGEYSTFTLTGSDIRYIKKKK